MKIAENIEALQVRMNFTGGESVIHPALLWDSEGATLVDTGMPGQLEELRVEIEGAKPLIKMNRERMARMMESLPEARRQQIERILSEPPSGKVDRNLRDGEELPLYDGGVEVIHTPGHTPGHLSLFVRKEKLLIAGDALRVEQGELVGPSESATPDMDSAKASLRKLTDYDIDRVLCYHGGYFGRGVSARIKELSAGR